MTSESEIAELIHTWARAVHEGDLDGVWANHADSIVMFDVPPPEQGIRGRAAYLETWPGFFEWQASGACFEIVELEVCAGEDVGFAWALLRCGTEQELQDDPDRRLRLTIGLQRVNGRWTVVHEHHSFTDTD